jgi:hypothetical protein
MELELSSEGNPDFGQNPNAPLWGCEPNKVVKIKSLEQASVLCEKFIMNNDLGSGNWSGGDIKENGRVIARVSYNGRVWKSDKSGSFTVPVELNQEIIEKFRKL